MASRTLRARCEMCDRLYSITRLSRSRYELVSGSGPPLDYGVLCIPCWNDLPLTVTTSLGFYHLSARAY